MKVKKKKILIIVLAALALLLLLAYFLFIAPLLREGDSGIVELDLMDGEVRISDKLSNFYIIPPIARSEIQEINVENKDGKYRIFRNASDKFQLENTAGLAFDDMGFASLIATPVAHSRVAKDLDASALAEYGLDTPQASRSITTTDGRVETVYIGDKMITGGGYYASVEGRNAVYIISSTSAEIILQPITYILKPLLLSGMSQSDYYLADNFMIYHGEDLFVAVDRMSADNAQTIDLALLYPTPEKGSRYYDINIDMYLNSLYTLIELTGDSAVALVTGSGTLMEYGLLSPAYRIHYSYGGYNFALYVSSQQKDGSFYAISNMTGYQLVCKIPEETLGWLTKGEFAWIQSSSFYEAIVDVARITMVSEARGVNADFVLSHSSNDEDDTVLEITDKVSGTFIPNSDSGNFRQYYLTLLNITNSEYTTLSEEDKAALMADDSRLVLTMTVKLVNGTVNEYKFYEHYEASTGHVSGGKMLVVVNGVGEFYTSNDLVDKVINDIPRVLEGLDVDAYGHN